MLGPPGSDLLHEKGLALDSAEEQDAARRGCSCNADPQRPRSRTTVPSAYCAFFRDNSLPEKTALTRHEKTPPEGGTDADRAPVRLATSSGKSVRNGAV